MGFYGPRLPHPDGTNILKIKSSTTSSTLLLGILGLLFRVHDGVLCTTNCRCDHLAIQNRETHQALQISKPSVRIPVESCQRMCSDEMFPFVPK